MMTLMLAWILVFFFHQDGRVFTSSVEGIPSARYCQTLGRENALPDIGWYCSRPKLRN